MYFSSLFFIMTIEFHNFPLILPDNEQQYFNIFEGVISSIDSNASVVINKGITEMCFRISPSEPKYSQIILRDVLNFNNLMGIKIEMSKSIRLTSSVSFNIQKM